MLGRETSQRHLLLIALPLCILLSLVLFQRRHPFFHSSYSKPVDGGATASTSEKPNPKDPSPDTPAGLPKESIAALNNETLGVRFRSITIIRLIAQLT